MYSLIVTAKMNDVDPQAWLADVLDRIALIKSKGSTNSCHGIGAPPSGTLIKPPEPKMTRARSSPDAYIIISYLANDLNKVDNFIFHPAILGQKSSNCQ